MLLFTLGVPLEVWHTSGSAERERRYYRRFVDAGHPVSFLTYGWKDEEYTEFWSPIRILRRKGGIQHYYYYAMLAPFYHWRAFRQAEIVKSNQSMGSLVGLVGKLIRPGLKLVVRCGWVRTRDMMISEHKRTGFRLRIALFSEWLAFRAADAVITVTESDADYITSHYGISRSKITVVPNSVDESQYYCRERPTDFGGRIKMLLVGRLVEMKNFHGVFEAVARTGRDIEIGLVGAGPYRDTLLAYAERFGVKVNFMGNVPNDALAGLYRDHDLVVMTEAYGSGMPKVVLEAMSSGVVVLASTIRSVLQIIKHGENGFLCEPTVDDIYRGLEDVFGQSAETLEAVRQRARRDIELNYSMHSSIQKEIRLYNQLLGRKTGANSKIPCK